MPLKGENEMGKASGLMSVGSLVQHTAMKCVVVGDGCVGKTCMLISYTQDRFPRDHDPTIFENYVAPVDIGSRTQLMGLYDTAGQEGFDRLRVLAYPKADIFLVCFSITSPDSMKNVAQVWVPEIRQNAGPDAKILIVGTKIDLREDQETLNDLRKKGQTPVDTMEGKKLARQLNVEGYLECSALTQKGVKNVFQEAGRKIFEPPKCKVTGLKRLMCWNSV